VTQVALIIQYGGENGVADQRAKLDTVKVERDRSTHRFGHAD
jgi:hypothetical protein